MMIESVLLSTTLAATATFKRADLKGIRRKSERFGESITT